jgi:ABC-type bacteriocin/lantibiotic exporter with double-glycine peptidase domain
MPRNRALLILFLLAGVQVFWLNRVLQPTEMVLVGQPLSWMSSDLTGLPVRDIRYPCGVICLSVISNLLGQPVPLSQSRFMLTPSSDGIVSLSDIEAACRGLQLQAAPAKVDPGIMPSGSFCIAHVSGGHFVVVRRDTGDNWTVIDTPTGAVRTSTTQLKKFWSGTGVFVGHTEADLQFLADED